MNDEKGQLSGEYMLLVGSLIVVLMISIFMIANENELNIAMAAAKSGADEGVASSSSAIYPKETFNEYDDMEGLKHPYSVSIVNVSYNSSGIDENYGKQKTKCNNINIIHVLHPAHRGSTNHYIAQSSTAKRSYKSNAIHTKQV